MWAFVIYFTVYGAPPVYFDSERRCMQWMATVQRYSSPADIKLMLCQKVRDTNEVRAAESAGRAGPDHP